MLFSLTILGNNSAVPAFGRNPTAQILQTQDQLMLIDCGEATQWQLSKYQIRRNKISHIFISHLHGDHYFGLIGLLNSMSLLGRLQPLHVYADPELLPILELQLAAADTILSYPFYFHPIEKEGEIANTNKLRVSCFPVKHRIKCWGFIFKEIRNPRTVDADRAKSYEIPSAFFENLQKGEDYITKKGVRIANESITTAAPSARTYAYCADTAYDESIIESVQGADLLYHETTFLAAQQEKATARFHSTTIEAATIAQKAAVKKLLIGHFSSRYDTLDQFLTEATEIFPETDLALEGTCFLI